MKKIFVGAFVLLFASIGILSGCSCSRDENTTGFVASNDLISYGAYSTVSLLSSFSGDMLSNQNMLFDSGNLGPILLTETTTDTEVESQIDMFHRYYSMLSPFIDSQSKDVMSYNHIEQDPDYEFTTEITVAIGAEHSQSMILKYNIGEQSIEYDDDDFEYGFVEIESYFSGVLVIDETVYNFEGYSEVKEGEEEFEIKAEIDSDNYVKMTLERDEGEIEYDYEISINGIVKKVSLEIEDDENQEFSIELEIEDDGVDSEFELKRELVDGVLITKVYYDVNGESGEMYVNETVDELGNKVIEYSIHPFNKQEKVIQREFRDIFGNTVS